MLEELRKKKDPDAAEIIQSRSVVIQLGKGPQLSEVVYRDKWGNQFTTFLEHN